jgi:putative endonuclease
MKMSTEKFNSQALKAATRFLAHRGIEVIETGWECEAGSADIIAKDDDALVFMELKARKGADQGFPSEEATTAKRDRYERIALKYLASHNLEESVVRFDILSLVAVAEDRALVRHHINAFSADVA